MTWLYVPGTTSASPVAGEDSTSGLTSEQAERLARSCSWRTKPRQPRSWSTAWRQHTFLRLLSGATCEPSTLQRGVDEWMGSLAATPASRFRTPVPVEAKTTPDTSGPPSLPGFEPSSPAGASSRTSPAICHSDSTRSPETFKAWATQLRRSSLQRRKSAPHTDASGSSSSQWQTPADFQGKYRRQVGQTERAERLLPGQAEDLIWVPKEAVQNWQTPTSAAETPNLGSNIKRGPKPLLAQAQRATPTARDHKDGANPSENVPTNGLLGRQAPRTQMPGDESSPSAPTSRRRLNPTFVEGLMNWPIGWTDLAVRTDCESWATASSLHRLPTHGGSSGESSGSSGL
jgi:hypothetical protein